MSGAGDILDQLDALHAAATTGPWQQDDEFPEDVVATRTAGIDVASCSEGAADAALIVAAVNALPQLTAAVRAVLDLIDPEAEMATGNGYDATRLFSERQIRDAIAAALSPDAEATP